MSRKMIKCVFLVVPVPFNLMSPQTFLRGVLTPQLVLSAPASVFLIF